MSERAHRRLLILSILVLAIVLVLGARLIQLVTLRGADLAAAAEANRIRIIPERAPRGLIVDSSGEPLVGSAPAAGVMIDRAVLAQLPDEGAAVLHRLADRLGLTERQLADRLVPCADEGAAPRPVCDEGGPLTPVTVLGDRESAVLPIAEDPVAFPGVTLTSSVLRAYPQPQLQSGNLLGYLGEPTSDELAADPGLVSNDRLGRGGLEDSYDGDLRGVSGQRQVLVDAMGKIRAVVQESPAVPGNDLVTSLDADLQERAESELAAALARAGNARARGAAVVLDVTTGRVLALASAPDFDPAEWVGGISSQRYRSLRRSGALIHYPVAGLAPPGSAFKPITVTAMEQAGLGLQDNYDCPASFRAGGRTFRNHESVGYGRISLRKALSLSCNTVFYGVGDRLWRHGGGDREDPDELDPIARAAVGFGLDRATGIDLPGESGGRIASPRTKYALWLERRDAWCAAAELGYPELRRTDPDRARYYTALDRENCEGGNIWRQGDAINAAIGQGLTAVTPLGLAVAYAAIANGGTVWQPTVGRAVVDQNGHVVREITPRRTRSAVASARALRFLRAALADVPRTGTAATAFAGFPLDRYPVAGKTGTAQVDGENSTAWFASFAPATRPRYAVVVMVTDAGGGGDVAAPAVRGVYETLFGITGPAAFGRSGPPTSVSAIRGVER